MKEKIFKEEMKGFNISIDDIEPSDDMFGAIEQAIIKMNTEYLIDRYEVVLNDNLIDFKDKITNFRTILGCRISYDNLSKDISFIVRKDTKSTYEQLEQELERYKNIIDELKEWFKGYHKSYASCKWYEIDYIEFIEHLEQELKGE